jgi:Protein of unknown function (DUF2505)
MQSARCRSRQRHGHVRPSRPAAWTNVPHATGRASIWTCASTRNIASAHRSIRLGSCWPNLPSTSTSTSPISVDPFCSSHTRTGESRSSSFGTRSLVLWTRSLNESSGRALWRGSKSCGSIDGRSGALHFEAEFDPRRLHGTGDCVLAETIDGTVIRLDGDLMIGIPGIGRLIERQIVPLLLHRLDIEAKALDDYLRQLAR